MKNQISVFIGSDEFICESFYDVLDKGGYEYGVEVFSPILSPSPKGYLGSIVGLEIPGLEDDEMEYTCFNSAVEDWLKTNYYA